MSLTRRVMLQSLGGAGGETHPYIQYDEYTHPEDWLSDSSGNTSKFVSTYCNKGDGMYMFGISASADAGNYQAIRGYYIKNNGNRGCTFKRKINWIYSVASGASFHIKAGSKIGVWYIPIDTALEDYV